MKKTAAVFAMLLVVALVFTGCHVTTTSTTTTTTTTTTADGATTTVTSSSTTSNKDGEVTTETTETTRYESVPTKVRNNTDFDIYGMYCSSSGDDRWGQELISAMFGENTVFNVGAEITTTFSYNLDDALFDFRIVRSDDGYVDFTQMDFASVAGDEQIVIVFEGTQENGYVCYFQK